MFRFYYYKCFYCNEQFSDLITLLEHTNSHEPLNKTKILKDFLQQGKKAIKVDISNLKCRLCDLIYININEIRNHLSLKHQIDFTKASNGMIEYNLEQKNGGFYCHLCNKIFQTFVLLNRHINIHFNNAVCEMCGAAFMNHQRLVQHQEIHSPNGHPCNQCKKVYSTAANLRYHIKKVHKNIKEIKILKCPYCPERFSEHYNKMTHLKEAHKINYKFECEICQTSFERRRSLTSHFTKMHTQKIKCNVCGKCFSIHSQLKTHMRGHTGERSFKCTICQKSYMHKRTLKHHMRVHGSVFKFTCEECGSGFQNRNDYNKHIKESHSQEKL